MSGLIRRAAAVLVLVLLTAGAAQAWPTASLHPALAAREAGSLAAAWEWLLSHLRKPRPKAGCGMDPDGKPLPCK
jgi:hypothetical protein